MLNKLMGIYSKIKKEHIYVFLVLFALLVVFTYFDDFNYTGLTTKGICTEKGYNCCNAGEGDGSPRFSLDYSCPESRECWDTCINPFEKSVYGKEEDPFEKSVYEKEEKSSKINYQDNQEVKNQITGNAILSDVGNAFSNAFDSMLELFGKEKVVGELGNLAPNYCKTHGGCPVGTIFVTNNHNYLGDFGGISGGDIICQQLANNIELEGTWRVLLGNSTNTFANRLYGWATDNLFNNPNIVYKNMNGDIVANDFFHFMGMERIRNQIKFVNSGNLNPLTNKLNYNQNGIELGGDECKIWTGIGKGGITRYCDGNNYNNPSWSKKGSGWGSIGDCTYDNNWKWLSDDTDRKCNGNDGDGNGYALYCIKTKMGGSGTTQAQISVTHEFSGDSQTNNPLEFSTTAGTPSQSQQFKITNTGQQDLTITGITLGWRDYSPATKGGEIISSIDILNNNNDPILTGITYSLGQNIILNGESEINVDVICNPQSTHTNTNGGNILSGRIKVVSSAGIKWVGYECEKTTPPSRSVSIRIGRDGLTNGELIFSTPRNTPQSKTFTITNDGDVNLRIKGVTTNTRGYSIGTGSTGICKDIPGDLNDNAGNPGCIEVISKIKIGSQETTPNSQTQSYTEFTDPPSNQNPIYLNTGTLLDIQVTCNPNAADSHTGKIKIRAVNTQANAEVIKYVDYTCTGTTSSPGTVNIQISGNDLNNGRLIFSTPIGTPQEKTFTITNTMNEDLTINSITLSTRAYQGEQGEIISNILVGNLHYRVIENNYNIPSFTLTNSQQKTITIECTPNSARTKTGEIWVRGSIRGNIITGRQIIPYSCSGSGGGQGPTTLPAPISLHITPEGEDSIKIDWNWIDGAISCDNPPRPSSPPGGLGSAAVIETNQITGNVVGDFFSNLWNSIVSIFKKEVKAQRPDYTPEIKFEIKRKNTLSGIENTIIVKSINDGCSHIDRNINPGKYQYKVKTIKDNTMESAWTPSTGYSPAAPIEILCENRRQCLEEKPLYCDENGQIINHASRTQGIRTACGCPEGLVPNPNLAINNCISPDNVEEICDERNVDDDRDGISDIFDTDCDNTDEFYLIALKSEGLKVSKADPYADSNIMVDCSYNVFNEDATIPDKNDARIDGSLKCIELDNIECEEKISTSASGGIYNAKFIDCNVGSQTGEKTISCFINENCIQEALTEGYVREIPEIIDVKEFNYCSNGIQGSININDWETDSNSYDEGETMGITANIQNFGDPASVIAKAALIDLSTGSIIKEASSTAHSLQFRAEEEFAISMIIPSFSAANYKLFMKAYAQGKERTECSQESADVEIATTMDEGDNGEPFMCETSLDCLENEECMDGICIPIDESCTAEEFRECDTGLPGICSEGVQTCEEDNLWGECQQSLPIRNSDIPDNGLDDDCDGEIDELTGPSSGGSGSERDSDNDELPDNWELQYFSNLMQDANEDYDRDGISNLQEFIDGTDPTDEGDKLKEGGLLWLWIILGIVLLAAILFFAFKLLTRPKSMGRIQGGNANPRLKDYVQDSLRKGFTKNQIRQALLTKGWSANEVDKALR